MYSRSKDHKFLHNLGFDRRGDCEERHVNACQCLAEDGLKRKLAFLLILKDLTDVVAQFGIRVWLSVAEKYLVVVVFKGVRECGGVEKPVAVFADIVFEVGDISAASVPADLVVVVTLF